MEIDLLVPREQGLDFDVPLDSLPFRGYRGVSVTYPYKEKAAAKVIVQDELIRAMRALIAVVFAPDGPRGFNTDFMGFIAAYRRAGC